MSASRFLIGLVAAAAMPACFATQLSDAAKAVLEDGSEPAKLQIVDDFAREVQRRLGAKTRVFAEVSVVRTYRQAGCKRLRVVISAPDVQAKDEKGQVRPFTFTQEQDLCADGDVPSRR